MGVVVAYRIQLLEGAHIHSMPKDMYIHAARRGAHPRCLPWRGVEAVPWDTSSCSTAVSTDVAWTCLPGHYTCRAHSSTWACGIQWNGQLLEEATWESVEAFRATHPSFQLEDKLFVEGPEMLSAQKESWLSRRNDVV
jgi:hypothetical protein